MDREGGTSWVYDTDPYGMVLNDAWNGRTHGIVVSIDLDLPGGGSRRLQTEGAGTEIGWSWLFPPYEATFDIRAVEPSKLIALDAAKLRDMMDTDQDFGNRVLKGMLKTFVGRLGQTRLQLLDIHSHRRADK